MDINCLRRSIARPRVYIAVSLNGDNTRCSNSFFFHVIISQLCVCVLLFLQRAVILPEKLKTIFQMAGTQD